MRYAAWLLVPMAVAASGGARAEDDLALIRKAVSESAPVATPTAVATPPKWLRVRVDPKGEKKGRVRVSVPLAFVRAVGDGLPMSFGSGCRREHKEAYCGIKLSEVLNTLEGGQSLVEIEDDEQSVRVWLE